MPKDTEIFEGTRIIKSLLSTKNLDVYHRIRDKLHKVPKYVIFNKVGEVVHRCGKCIEVNKFTSEYEYNFVPSRKD